MGLGGREVGGVLTRTKTIDILTLVVPVDPIRASLHTISSIGSDASAEKRKSVKAQKVITGRGGRWRGGIKPNRRRPHLETRVDVVIHRLGVRDRALRDPDRTVVVVRPVEHHPVGV